ncbi:MAG: type IV pilus assembly protein PilM [bacterium]|jgi:type IV pilus assembly protein PilM|nr:type IV pilus assembly protein PilM [bacterium]
MKLIRNIQPLLGLDIGTTSIKAVVLKESVSSVAVIDYRIEEFPLSTEKKENVPLEIVLEGLRKCLEGINFKKMKIVTVVSGQRVSVRKVLIPHMPKEELLEAIKWEAKEHIPFPVENAALDYHIIGEVTDKGAKKIELLVVAVEKFVIDQHLSLLQNVQIRPASVTVTPFALAEVLRKSDYLKTDEALAVVRSGADTTAINIFSGENLVFNREIPLGGNSLTRAMVGTLISDSGQVDLDINQAEILKKDWGIPDEKNPQQLTPEISSLQIAPLMRPILERLANEIRRSLDYYREESRGKRVSKVVLLGGNAELKGLQEFLNSALGLTVEICHPLRNLELEMPEERKKELDQLSPRLAIAMGASLQGTKGINLLPQEIKEQATKTARSAMAAVIGFLIVFIFSMVYASLHMTLRTYEKVIESNQTALNDLKQQVARAYELQQLKEKMTTRRNLINLLMMGNPRWVELLKALSNLTPRRIILEEVVFQKEVEEANNAPVPVQPGEGGVTPAEPVKEPFPILNIKGMVMLGGERPEAVLAQFMQALEKSSYFMETDLYSLTKGQESEGQRINFINFEIQCKLRDYRVGE